MFANEHQNINRPVFNSYTQCLRKFADANYDALRANDALDASAHLAFLRTTEEKIAEAPFIDGNKVTLLRVRRRRLSGHAAIHSHRA